MWKIYGIFGVQKYNIHTPTHYSRMRSFDLAMILARPVQKFR